MSKQTRKDLNGSYSRKFQPHFNNFGSQNSSGLTKIQYKAGKENVVAYTLSRVQGAEILCMAIPVVDSNLKGCIIASCIMDDNTMAINSKATTTRSSAPLLLS